MEVSGFGERERGETQERKVVEVYRLLDRSHTQKERWRGEDLTFDLHLKKTKKQTGADEETSSGILQYSEERSKVKFSHSSTEKERKEKTLWPRSSCV